MTVCEVIKDEDEMEADSLVFIDASAFVYRPATVPPWLWVSLGLSKIHPGSPPVS